ncbi:MAG: nucleoside deaminase [Geminicoccaceae bacterium]
MRSSLDDEAFLRRAIAVAAAARARGNHPFGAILVGPDGKVLLEAENSVTTGRDATAHAERNLMSAASQRFDRALLARSTMYTSTEPCAMCAGSVYWTGVRRVVFGLSERGLLQLTGSHPENPTLDLPCRTVFAGGQTATEVVGPLLAEEASAVHAGFWA